MTAEFFALAFTAALNPKLLAAGLLLMPDNHGLATYRSITHDR